MIALLIAVFVAWRWIRPPAQPLLRMYAGTGALLVFVVSTVQTCFVVSAPEGAARGCRLVLDVALVVIASLSLEIGAWMRHRGGLLPRAIARWRRARSVTRSR
ncbi:MAG TPA: hypothetical protein VLX92_23555 [Kofleriaceae bacterium]|nr:hypothetical protein [Kofleriaceae bacterium]